MIVFQNLQNVQELLDYEIKEANNKMEINGFNGQEKNVKAKNIKSKFLEKSKHILRAIETIYINEKFMKINTENDKTLNEFHDNPYISDEKSCITAFNGLSVIQDKGILNIS